jgi:hypothetical protein
VSPTSVELSYEAEERIKVELLLLREAEECRKVELLLLKEAE